VNSYGTKARAPTGHRMRLRHCFFPAPEGGRKTRLGGELRREEQRLSRTGVCVDREGTVDDVSDGGLSPPFPPPTPALQESHMSTCEVGRLDEHKLTILADRRPRRG
jgi:hypothetical protein